MNNVPELAEWILEQTTDALVYSDTDGTIRRWNHAAEVLFAFRAAGAIGRNLTLTIPEHRRRRHWPASGKATPSATPAPPGPRPRRRPATRTGGSLIVE